MYRNADHFKRVTVNLPKQLLDDGQVLTEKGITETLVAGLELLRRQKAYKMARQLKGKLCLDLDLDLSRERTR